MLDFFEFIEERKAIERKKSLGLDRPWTNDPVLHNTRFTNLNRDQDRGTIRLYEKVKSLDDAKRIKIIVLYRTGYSSATLLNALTGNSWDDIIWLRTNKNWLGTYLPYQVLMHKGENIGGLMQKSCFDVATFAYQKIDGYNHESIATVANDIAGQFKKTHLYHMIFLGTEIAKDLAHFYPDQIDPDSVCPFNKGARAGLQWMYEEGQLPNMYRVKARIDCLKEKTGMNFSILEHASCEYGKFCERKKTYADPKSFIPNQWLYTPSTEPLYKFSDSLSA